MKIAYLYSKIIKKIRGKALLNCSIHKTAKVEAGSQLVNVTMGKYSFCGYDCEINNCSIGNFCSISNQVVIGGAMHPTNWAAMSPVFYEGRDSVTQKFSVHKREPDKKTSIGHDVWIGYRVIIRQGVVIGNGAVIGMGAIVTKDVAPYSVVGGNPARLIKFRFDPLIIRQLQESAWWELPEKELRRISQFVKNPTLFLNKINPQ